MLLEEARAVLSGPDVHDLQSRFRGPVLRPGEDGYEEARAIWNGAIDRRPALIARCTGTADVRQAVRFARDRDLPVSVRGGGHNVAGSAVCDGGLMIDLSPMKAVVVDPERRTVAVEPGVVLGELDGETQKLGLAVPAGIVTHTGVAGLTLGGGIGWLMRKHALTCDNLLSARVVTAEGAVVEASEEENGDLLWALRGGGGNFGIVTSFEFRAHPTGPTVLAGSILYAASEAAAVLSRYQEFVAVAPDELTTIVTMRTAPSLPVLPPEVHGTKVIAVNLCWVGPPEPGEGVAAQLRRLGSPVADTVAHRPFTEVQGMFDATVPSGHHYYWKSLDLPDLTEPLIGVMAEHGWATASPLSYTIMFQLGGAVSRIGEGDTAYGNREAAFAINVNGVSADGSDYEAERDWARAFWAAVEPHSTGGVYVNFLMDEGVDRVRAAYGSGKYERLASLKARFDPTNFFRLNQNIAPGSAG